MLFRSILSASIFPRFSSLSLCSHLSLQLSSKTLSVSLVLSTSRLYVRQRQNTQQCFPDIELLSYHRVEQQAWKLSGVLTWEHHICVWSCVGFTGPYANLEQCPCCGESCYKEQDLEESGGERKVPRQVFTMFPVGPQLQACWKNPRTAKDMHYLSGPLYPSSSQYLLSIPDTTCSQQA